MKKVVLKYGFWFLFSTSTLLGIFGDFILKQYTSANRNITLHNFQTNLYTAEKHALSLLDTISNNSLDENKKAFSRLEAQYLKHGIAFYIYENNDLKLWSNTEALPPFYFSEFYRATYHQTENGSYLFFVKSNGQYHSVVSINLIHHYLFSNKYLVDNSPIDGDFAKFFSIGKPDDYETKLSLSSGQNICSVNPKKFNPHSNFFEFGLFTIFILLLVFSGSNYIKLASSVVLYLVFRTLGVNECFHHSELFDAALYSGYFLNLGDLIFATVLLTRIVRIVKNHLLLLVLKYALLLACPLFIKDIVINSVIVVNTANTLELSFWSFVSFLALSLLYSSLVRLFFVSKSKPEHLVALISLLLGLGIIFILKTEWIILIYPITGYISTLLNKDFKPTLLHQGLLIAFLASIGFVHIEYLTFKKEQNNLPILVKNLVNQRDNIAEFLLTDFRKNLTDDPYVKTYFSHSFLPKSAVKERLEKLYLRGYLKKFGHQILFAPKKVKFGLHPDMVLVEQINSILQNESNRISEGIYNAKLTGISKAYLIEQSIVHQGDTLGSLYVLLKEKSFYDQSIYPELLIGAEEKKSSKELNFALYQNHKLNTSVGQLSYPLFLLDEKQNIENQLNANFKHFFFSPDNQTHFIVSVEKRTVLNYTTSFSIFLFITVLLGFLILFARQIFYGTINIRTTWANTSFSNRIRISALGAVFLALVLLAYATTVYTQKKYEQQTLESLITKAKKANLNFTSFYNNKKQSENIKDELTELVLQFSELYEADIDVFDKNGSLLASSQKILFENGILENQIDGSAYYEMAINGKSLFVKNEQIGRLSYTSAFVPILLNEAIVAFVQLPYFARQQDLRKDQANFIVTLFNIYLIILLLLASLTAIILRSITRPLSLITGQLKNTSLTGNNEKIKWDKNDEIGLLVKEYNEMIDKLEQSAKHLADSKQAEAWQQMARQVAHEIKNPLTPMKLNIQQLQKAWNDQHPTLENVFKKVTHILISQIESLAKIATEFSSFAQMPKLDLTTFKFSELLIDIEQLYNTNKPIVVLKNNAPEVFIKGDKDQLFRAINNVVKNAIQAVHDEKPIVEVSVFDENTQLKIEISDNGKGIDNNMIDKVFIPNFSTKSSGMGLGLAIVKQILENHKGSVSFKSNEIKGTTFIITIPKA